MPTSPSISIRVSLAKPSRGYRDPVREAATLAAANGPMARALTLGLQKLVFRAQKERFTGKGPFPVSERRLGVVSGRLRRDLHAETVVETARGYEGRIGAAVEYLGVHEFGFSGTVNVPAHRREAYTVKRKKQSRTSKSGKTYSVRANQYSVLPTSVRAHSRSLNIPARMPLRTAIEQHAEQILGTAIRGAVQRMTEGGPA